MIHGKGKSAGFTSISFFLILLAILALIAPEMARAEILRVKAGATGAGNGSSWTDAYTSISIALGASTSGTEIWVAQGTYKPGNGRTDAFMIPQGVALYGGFAGTEASRDERDWRSRPTILSGDIGTEGDVTDNSYHVVQAADGSSLNGFIISFGRADGDASPQNSGGGLLVTDASAQITNCVFTQNSGTYGAGAATSNSSTVFESCIFYENSAGYGGGIAFNGGAPKVSNCLFYSNNGEVTAGAIVAYTCSGSVINSTFYKNTDDSVASTMATYVSSFQIVNCIIWNDTTSVEILNNGLPITVTNTLIRGGVAGISGGNVVNGGGNLNTDPLFLASTDLDGADNLIATADDGLSLTAASPCVSAGTASGITSVDLAGTARPSGEGVDMGAYERYQAVVVPAAAVSLDSPNGDGWFRAGVSIVIRVTFDKAVNVSGTPVLTLETGAIDRQAAYSSGSGSSVLSFSYVISSGDTSPDLDCVSASALTLEGGTITDQASGQAATLALPVPGAAGSLSATRQMVVDTTPPSITSAQMGEGGVHVDLYLGEGVYSTASGSGDPSASSFNVLLGSGAATGVTITGVTLPEGGAPAGSASLRLALSYTGIPSSGQTLEVRPANGSSLYDRAGNAMLSTATSGSLAIVPEGQGFTIAGTVTVDGSAAAGVSVEVVGLSSVATGVDGTYLLENLTSGEYFLRPWKSGVNFTPSYIALTLGPSAQSMNFAGATGTASLSIGGRVADSSGNALKGVSVEVDGTKSVLTNASGYYLLTGLSSGSHTLTAGRTNYTFTPSQQTISLTEPRSDVNFTGEYSGIRYTISGAITNAGGTPIAGVAMKIAGRTESIVTSSDGNYVYGGLEVGTYILTPELSEYTFDPESITFTVGPSSTGRNFTATFQARPTGVTARYLRLTYLSLGSSSWFQLNEIKVFDATSSTPGELIPIQSMLLSRSAMDGFGKDKLTDGVIAYNQDFVVRDPGTQMMITLDLGSDKSVHGLWTYNDGAYGAGKVRIEYLKENETWNSLGEYDLTLTAGQSNLDMISFSSTIVINEVKLANPSWVELTNAGKTSVSLKNWMLFTAAGNYVIPDLTLLPGQYLVINEGSGTNGTLNLYSGLDITWASNQAGYVYLSDPSGKGIDYVKWNSSTHTPPEGLTFTGTAPVISDDASTLGRNSNALDTDQATDFHVEEPTQGAKNLAPDEIEYFTVSGKILDSSGNPVQGAILTAGTATATSDAAGSYTISSLRAGTYTVVPALSGYTFSPTGTAVTLGPSVGETDFTATVVAEPSKYSLGGIVYLSYGTMDPVGGVVISASPGNHVTVTGYDGTYLFTDVQEGTYTITPIHSSLTFLPATRSVTLDRNKLDENFTADVVIQTYSITGHVYNSSGGAIQGASIELTTNSGLSQSVLTDATGSWTFQGLKTDSYRVGPVLEHWEFSPAYVDIASLSSNRTGVDFTGTQPYYEVQGYIRDGSGNGVSGITVEIQGIGEYLTDGIGKFRAVNILPGTYLVTPKSTEKSFSPTTQTVTLGPSRTDVNFFLSESRYTISGYVRMGTDPLVGVTLTLSNGRQTISGTGGYYSFDQVVAGTYGLTPTLSGYAFSPATRTVVLASDSASNDFAATAATYSISGKVVNSSGIALQGVSVTVGTSTTITDLSGQYTVSGLAAGTWQILPSLSGYTFSPQSLSAQVGPDSTANNFYATRSYSLSGRVSLAENSSALPNVQLTLVPGGTASTDSSGNYTLSGLTAGTYKVTPSRTGYTFSPSSWTFTVSGSDLTKDFSATFLGATSTLYVDASAQAGGDGSTDRPFTSINGAMEASDSGTRIVVRPGTYRESVVMKYGVSITGISLESTIIDGQGATRVIQASQQCSIERVTVRNSSTFDGSAGIFSYGCSPRISNCLITNCYDGILVYDGSPSIVNSTVVNNLGYSLRARGTSSLTVSSSILDRLVCEGGSASAVVSYSDIIQGGYGVDTGTGNIAADPNFKGPSIGDYTLASASPCINMGDPAAERLDTDGSRNDMGAFGGPAMTQASSARIDVITISSSPTAYPGWGESKLIDGTITANSDYAVRNQRSVVNLTMDLGQDQTLNGIKFVNDGEYGTTRVSIYAARAAAPGAWTTVGTYDNLTWTKSTQVQNSIVFNAIQARYLIFRAELFANDTWFQMNELEVYGIVSSATASTQQPIAHGSSVPGAFAGYEVSYLYDGLTEYNSDFAIAHGTGYSTINLDMGSEITLDRIYLYNDGLYGAKSLAVYYARAATPSTYSLIGLFSELSGAPETPVRNIMDFTSVQARYVRLEIREYYHAQWLQLNEVQVFGSAGDQVELVQHSIQSIQSQAAGLAGHTLTCLNDGRKVYNGDYAVSYPSTPLDILVDLGRDSVVHEIRHYNDGEYGGQGVYLWYATASAPSTWNALGHFALNTSAGSVNMDILPITPATMRYVRFRYTEFTGRWFQINELEIYGQASSSSDTAPVTISSIQCDRVTITGMGPETLYNGTRTYNSEFALRSPGSQVSLTIDLGSDKWISRLDHWNDGAYGGKTMEVSYATSSSPDFVALVSVDSLGSLDGQANLNRIYFSPVTARKVKITYTAFASASWLQLSEYEFYGPASTASSAPELVEAQASMAAVETLYALASEQRTSQLENREGSEAISNQQGWKETSMEKDASVQPLTLSELGQDYSLWPRGAEFLVQDTQASWIGLQEPLRQEVLKRILRGGLLVLEEVSEKPFEAGEDLAIRVLLTLGRNFPGGVQEGDEVRIFGAGALILHHQDDDPGRSCSGACVKAVLNSLSTFDQDPLLGPDRCDLLDDSVYLQALLQNDTDMLVSILGTADLGQKILELSDTPGSPDLMIQLLELIESYSRMAQESGIEMETDTDRDLLLRWIHTLLLSKEAQEDFQR